MTDRPRNPTHIFEPCREANTDTPCPHTSQPDGKRHCHRDLGNTHKCWDLKDSAVHYEPGVCPAPSVGWCQTCDQFHVPVITPTSSREDILTWLKWNDPNGVYDDEEIAEEGLTPWTLEQAIDQATEQGAFS